MATLREHWIEFLTFRQMFFEAFELETAPLCQDANSQAWLQEQMRVANANTRALLLALVSPSGEIEKAQFHTRMSAPIYKRANTGDFIAKGVLIGNDMKMALHVYNKNGFLPAPFYPLKPVEKGKSQ